MQARDERPERLPAFVTVMLVQARHWAVQHHQVELAVARQIHELRLAGQAEIWLNCDTFERGKLNRSVADRAEVALVEPGAGLLGEYAGDALAVQVCPLIACAVHASGEILQAFGVDLLDFVLHDRLAVYELDWGQAAFEIVIAVMLVAGLGDGAQDGVDRLAGVGRRLLVRVSEISGANKAVISLLLAAWTIRNVVEHQHALAEAVGAHFKARPIGGEWILARLPRVLECANRVF